jgi:hypothetical protein
MGQLEMAVTIDKARGQDAGKGFDIAAGLCSGKDILHHPFIRGYQYAIAR